MNYVKHKYVKGSIFETEKYKLDAISVFIPCGLTAIRVHCKFFYTQFGRPIENHHEFLLFKNNYINDKIKSLKYLLVDQNRSHKIYQSWDIKDMVAYTLGRLSKLGVKRIGMNGIRTSGGNSEWDLVHEVGQWIASNDHEFEEIYFIDLRGGFGSNQ